MDDEIEKLWQFIADRVREVRGKEDFFSRRRAIDEEGGEAVLNGARARNIGAFETDGDFL
jgi:hypothetical protein